MKKKLSGVTPAVRKSSLVLYRAESTGAPEMNAVSIHCTKVRNRSAVWLVVSWSVCLNGIWSVTFEKRDFQQWCCEVFCDKGYIQQWFPTLRSWNFKMWVVSPKDWNSIITVWKFWETTENIFILVMMAMIGKYECMHFISLSLSRAHQLSVLERSIKRVDELKKI